MLNAYELGFSRVEACISSTISLTRRWFFGSTTSP